MSVRSVRAPGVRSAAASWRSPRSRRLIGSAGSHLVLILFAFTALAPLALVAINSLKTHREVVRSPLAMPTTLHWENFEQAWRYGQFSRGFVNSILLSGTSTQDVRVPVVVEDVSGSNFLHRDVEGCNVVRVPAGTQSVQLVIPTRDDANDEADGSVWARLGDAFLSLFQDVPDRAGYELASDGMEAQVSVVDNDDPSGTPPDPPPGSNRCRAVN